MESIRNIYRIGHGPSSSHTMGPKKAAQRFLGRHPETARFRVTLYGSLAATGKGHLTDKAILEAFSGKKTDILWEPSVFLDRHPNALKFEALDTTNQVRDEWTVYSIGGGAIVDGTTIIETAQVYPHQTMAEILTYCQKNGLHFSQYVRSFEAPETWPYLQSVWQLMEETIRRGLEKDDTLPGGLKLPRKAYALKFRAQNLAEAMKRRTEIFAYALAVAEENASGGKIVTAPTCGACGVLPAVLYYFKDAYQIDNPSIIKALATAGLIDDLVKHNASISGAEVGCQGEIGTACAMASAAAAQMMGGTIYQIEYAAEMGLEHHLGLTCDPVGGLVQIPCIERNAFAAERSLSHATYALLSDGRHRISFDEVVETMYKTGLDLKKSYRETSIGGLALLKAIPNC
jgi:L-serine dehydratase